MERFGGERFDPVERGRGADWARWKKGQRRAEPRAAARAPRSRIPPGGGEGWVTDGKPNSELGASNGPKETIEEWPIIFAAEPAMKSAMAILILVGSIGSAFSEETCTPQSVQFCNQQSVSCFNNSQCRGNPNNCKRRCCLVYTSCLSARSCDASAYRCSN